MMRPNTRAFMYLLFALQSLAVIAFAVHLGALTPKPQRHTGNQRQPTAQTDQGPQPGVAEIVTQGDITQGSKPEQGADARGVVTNRAWFKDPNWVIALITFVLAAVAIWQMILTRNSVKAAERAADAAKESADAAIILNQPYLDTANWRAEIMSDPTGQVLNVRVYVNVFNRGTTPTKFTRITARCATPSEFFDRQQARGVLLPAGESDFVYLDFGPIGADTRKQWESNGIFINVTAQLQFTNLFPSKDSRTLHVQRRIRLHDKSGCEAMLPEGGANDEITND